MRQVHEVHGLPDHGAVDPPPPLLLQADRGRQTPEPTAPGPQPPEPARLMVLTGCGFSTTQQPSLCQKSLIFAVASSFAPSRGAAPVQRPPHGVTPWGRVGDLVGVAEPVGMDLGEAERVGRGGEISRVLTPQINPKSTSHRLSRDRDTQGTPSVTQRPPGTPGHLTPTQRSCPGPPAQDGMLRQDGGTEAAMANPSSLSQAAINIPAFPKRGRRFGSSAPDQRQTEGKNRINRGVCPKTATAPAGGRQSWVGRGCGKRVHPQIGASSHQGQTNIPVPKRPAARTALTARGGEHSPARPRSPGRGRGVPGTAELGPSWPPRPTGAGPTAPANRKSPFLCPAPAAPDGSKGRGGRPALPARGGEEQGPRLPAPPRRGADPPELGAGGRRPRSPRRARVPRGRL